MKGCEGFVRAHMIVSRKMGLSVKSHTIKARWNSTCPLMMAECVSVICYQATFIVMTEKKEVKKHPHPLAEGQYKMSFYLKAAKHTKHAVHTVLSVTNITMN